MHVDIPILITFWVATTAVFLFYATPLPRFFLPTPGASAMATKCILDVLTADTAHLQTLLRGGKINSSGLVDVYLAQLHKQDGYLHAMIQLTSLPLLKSTAEVLDRERKDGKLRGPLHSIFIIIEVNSLSFSY